jgi:hypothetical protein
MATGRLTDIIKARRESGKGVASSLAGGFKERLKEKFDPRNVFNQNGLLTSLFPKLKAYRSQDLVPEKADVVTPGAKPGLAAGGSVDSLKPLFLSIEKSTKTIAKNNASLSLIQRDTNSMKQTLSKIVRVISGRKKKEERKKKPFASLEDTILAKPLDEEDDKGGILGTILGVIAVIKGLINSVVGFLKNIIGSFVKNFLPVLRTIAQLGTRFLPMLASVPVLVSALAALAAYSVFKLGSDYRKGKETQADLILLRQKKKDGTATPEELKRLTQLEAEGVTASPGEAKQMAAVRGAANTGLPILKQLEDEIKSGKTKESDANDLILESTGFDLAMLREFKKARDADPKVNNDLVTFAANKGVQSTKLKNVYIRPQTPEAMDAVYRNRSVGFGDELTAQLVGDNKIGEGGVEASAQSPTAVLRLIEDYKKENDDKPNILEGKTIFLSTGFENSNGSTKEFDTVLKQILSLKSMGASDNAIKILGVSEQAKNATEINDGLKKIASKNNNEYLPVANKKKLGKTFVSDAMSGKKTLPTAAADVDDQGLGQAIASALAGGETGASTKPTPAPSAADTGGATAPIPTAVAPDNMYGQDTYTTSNTGSADLTPDNMYGQDTYTTSNTGSADLKPALSAGDDPPPVNGASTELVSTTPSKKDLSPLSGDSPPLEPAPAAASQTPQTQENGNPEPIKQNKLPIDDPYNDQHPQFSSLIKKLANEYGVPA